MSTSIEAQGHTVDEAIQIALNQLGVSRDKVEIDILHHPRRGVLGIGARRAKVRATIRESVMLDGEEFDMSGGTELDDKPRRRRRRGGRSRGEGGAETGSEAPAASAAPRPAPAREPGRPEGDRRGGGRRDEGGRGRDDRRGGRGQGGDRQGGQAGGEGSSGRQAGQGGQGGRGGQQRGGQQRDQRQPRESGQQRDGSQQRDQQPPREGQQARDAQQPREADGRRQGGREDGRGRNSGRGRQGGRGQDERRGGESGRSEVEAVPGEEGRLPQPAASRPSAPRRQQPVVEEPALDAETLELVRARADEVVRELLEKMGFPAEVTSSVDLAAGEAVVSVRSESEGLLIGRRGQTLDSLEHIVNRMVLRGESYVEGRILLDIGDYRKRRRESLDELAARLRGRAVDERRSVQVSPMSPRDRKYFALAFAGDDSVEVRALGAGFYRRVIVAPAGMASSGMDVENVTADTDELDQQDNVRRPMRAPEAGAAEAAVAPIEAEAAPRGEEAADPGTENPTVEAEN